MSELGRKLLGLPEAITLDSIEFEPVTFKCQIDAAFQFDVGALSF